MREVVRAKPLGGGHEESEECGEQGVPKMEEPLPEPVHRFEGGESRIEIMYSRKDAKARRRGMHFARDEGMRAGTKVNPGAEYRCGGSGAFIFRNLIQRKGAKARRRDEGGGSGNRVLWELGGLRRGLSGQSGPCGLSGRHGFAKAMAGDSFGVGGLS